MAVGGLLRSPIAQVGAPEEADSMSAWDWLFLSSVGLFVALAALILLILFLRVVRTEPATAQQQSDPAPYDASQDRSIVRWQLGLGAFLVLAGATLGVVVHEIGPDSDADVGLSIATAVIGVGAALLPAGAAATASNRILASLPKTGESTAQTPTLSEVRPEEADKGIEKKEVRLKGTGFVAGATVKVEDPVGGSEERKTTFMSDTELKVTLEKKDLEKEGTLRLSVKTPAGTSTSKDFTVKVKSADNP